jgi:hypothetical protein
MNPAEEKRSMSDTPDDPEETGKDAPAEPPGEGDSLEDAAQEAVREIDRRGTGHAGTGDIG